MPTVHGSPRHGAFVDDRQQLDRQQQERLREQQEHQRQLELERRRLEEQAQTDMRERAQQAQASSTQSHLPLDEPATRPSDQAHLDAVARVRTDHPPTPPGEWPPRAQEIVNELCQRYPGLARGNDEDRRTLTRMMSEQIRHELGDAWGTKSAGDGRPQSKDAIAFRMPDGNLVCWDWQNGASRQPQIPPLKHEITGQVFIEVEAKNHIALNQVVTPTGSMYDRSPSSGSGRASMRAWQTPQPPPILPLGGPTGFSPLATVPALEVYSRVTIDRSSPEAAVNSAAAQVRQARRDLFNLGAPPRDAMEAMTELLGVLRANGVEAHRLVTDPAKDVGDPSRYDPQALVVDGTVWRLGGDAAPGQSPRLVETGPWDPTTVGGARE